MHWPTSEQLEQMGLVRCKHETCKVYVDPLNVPSRRCNHHTRAMRRQRRLAEVRFAPRPQRAGQPA